MAKAGKHGLDEQQLEGGVGAGGGMGRGSSTKIKEAPIDIKEAVEAAEKYHLAKYGTKSFPRRPSRDEREQDAKERQYEKYSGKDLNYRGSKSEAPEAEGNKKGGMISASRRADGIAQRGKTRGKMC